MKIFQKLKMMAIALIAQNAVIAFFDDPSAGASAAYKEGDFIGEKGAMSDNTQGKQILVNAGNGKCQVLAFDTDSSNANKNPNWFAPAKNWLLAVPTTKDIDFDNSDIVFGNGQTVTLGKLDNTKNMPFKRVGNAIKYDASLAQNAPVSNFSGGGTSNTTPAPANNNNNVTNPPPANNNGTTPAPAKDPVSTIKGWAWYVWLLVIVGAVAIFMGIKALLSGKKEKVVKK